MNGRQNEIVVKVLSLSLAAKKAFVSFRFKSPYTMVPHGSKEIRLNWNVGYIACHDLYTVMSEPVDGFLHLYRKGI